MDCQVRWDGMWVLGCAAGHAKLLLGMPRLLLGVLRLLPGVLRLLLGVLSCCWAC